MKIVVLGLPYAGKSTQAQRLAKNHNIAYISASKIFRSEKMEGIIPTDQVADQIIERELMPDHAIIILLQCRLQYLDCQKGFIFDGFPRSLRQAETMKQVGIHLDLIINVEVPENAIISRYYERLEKRVR